MAETENMVQVTDDTFTEEVHDSPLPVLVDFWAPWCGPCIALEPALEEVAEAYAGKLKVVRMNVDDSVETAGRFGIRSIPTLMLFKNGDIAETIVGLVSRERIEEFVEKVVA